MISVKMLSGLAARTAFRRRVASRVRKLALSRGRDGDHEKVTRPANGVPHKWSDGRGGPDHKVLDITLAAGRRARLSANSSPVYRSEVIASVELDGELVYMRTKGGGVELMADPASWFRVIDEIEGKP